jgi:hypothetical protein
MAEKVLIHTAQELSPPFGLKLFFKWLVFVLDSLLLGTAEANVN